jgi:hypothetical protein
MPGTGREGRRARGPGLHAGKRGRRISYTGRARSTAGRRARAPRRGKVRQANQLYRPGREGDAREIVGTYCLCTRPASGRRGREGRGSAALRRASEPCARVLRSATQTLQRGSPPRGSPATARASAKKCSAGLRFQGQKLHCSMSSDEQHGAASDEQPAAGVDPVEPRPY